MATQPDVFVYDVDAGNRLVAVGHGWEDFAVSNGAPGLSSESVLGRPLLSFFASVETRHIYGLLLDQVRASGATIKIPFRCDGPAVRRYMELTISLQPPEQVRFESRIVREEPRPPVRLLEAGVERGEDFVVICSWCKLVEVEGGWLEVEEAIDKLGIFDEPVLPRISHGCCSPCFEHLRHGNAAPALVTPKTRKRAIHFEAAAAEE